MEKKLTARQAAMIKELKKNYHNITAACEKVGVSRDTHYSWRAKSDAYKKADEDISEGLLDRAENILTKRLEESDTALIFFLKTKGKKRGYIEKQEIEHSGEMPLVQIVTGSADEKI